MSDNVLREATILIRYKTEKGSLSSPDVQQVAKAHEEVAKAVEHTARAHREATKAAKEYGAVPGDWAQLFKSQAEARKYAYSIYGERGNQELKENPAQIAHFKRMDDALGTTGENVERFGQRSAYAYGRGLMGITEFGRGLALLASNGSKDSQKLVESIIQVQGAVDILRGGFQIARLGPELGVIAALVAAGTGAWMLYSQQVQKAKETIEGLTKAHIAESQAQSKLFIEREKLIAQGRASQTDANFNSTARRAAQDQELAGIREQRKAAEEKYATDEKARKQRTETAERNRSEASQAPGGLIEGLLQGYGSGSAIGEAQGRANRLRREADDAEKAAAEFATREQANINQRLQDAEREKDILQSQRQDRLQQVRKTEEEQLGNLRRSDDAMSPMEKARREVDKIKFDQQRQQLVPLAQGADAFGFGIPFAGATTRGMTFQGQREEPIRNQARQSIDRINEAASSSMQQTEALLTNLRTLLAGINSELEKNKNAHSN